MELDLPESKDSLAYTELPHHNPHESSPLVQANQPPFEKSARSTKHLRHADEDQTGSPLCFKQERRPRKLSPLVADAKRLAKLLTSGLRTIRTWDAAGKLPMPIRLGGRVLWIVDEIRDWLAAGAPDRDTWEAAKAREKGRASVRCR